jgi:serine/threonine protein kinase
MGTVYKAHHIGLNKIVAVKILPSSFARDPERVKRFVREARAAAQLEHSGIVQILNIGKTSPETAGDTDIYYIVMQYVQGDTVAQMLRTNGKLPVPETSRIIRDTAKSLNAAHQKGIIHRDVKPENIMVTYEGEVRLMDFGLARVLDVASHLSQPGDILGTPHYLAPEQAQSMSVDGRADIYSLGVTYYYALTGQKPFDGDTPVAVIMQHINKQPLDPRQFSPEIPDEVCLVIQKMLAKNPDERYQNCNDLISDLETIMASSAVDASKDTAVSATSKTLIASDIAKPVPQPKRRSRMARYILGAGISAVIIGLALAAMEKKNSLSKPSPPQPSQDKPVTKPEIDDKSERVKHLKDALTKRSSEFYSLLLAQSYDELMPFFNPVVIDMLKKASGGKVTDDVIRQRLKKLMQLQFDIAELQGLKVVGFRPNKINLMPRGWASRTKELMPADAQWAEIDMVLLVKSELNTQVQEAPQRHFWVLVNNVWYFHPRKDGSKPDDEKGTNKND